MNPVELACVKGYSEILKYFVDELNLRKKVEFNAECDNLQVEAMPFIYVPIV